MNSRNINIPHGGGSWMKRKLREKGSSQNDKVEVEEA
jgi:hypothetical protein